MISVMLADDHQVVIDGFKAVLAKEGDVRVVGECNDGLQVLAAIEKQVPDVLILDVMMPGLNGLEVLRLLRSRAPGVRTVVLSMHEGLGYVSEALRHGAAGYVLKQAPASELVRAIRAVMAGGRYLSPPLDEAQVAEHDRRSKSSTIDPFDTLSAREREVFQLAAEGLTNAEIGGRLAIGRRTVETHRANLIRKLGLKTQADLVRLAVRRGLLPPE
jgi:DNA-binding NarL/FixJ family response regulator